MIWELLFVLAIVAAVPFVLEARRKRIGAPERRASPGKSAVLSQGVTHYQWLGPVRGPIVVAIHGMATPSTVWTEVAEGLGSIGYRVLVYDLYGRGLSDAPNGAQDAPFFLRQLTDLLANQGVGQDLTVDDLATDRSLSTADLF